MKGNEVIRLDSLNHPSPNDWVEDFNQENGNYNNECFACKVIFLGNKHRLACRVCSEKKGRKGEGK